MSQQGTPSWRINECLTYRTVMKKMSQETNVLIYWLEGGFPCSFGLITRSRRGEADRERQKRQRLKGAERLETAVLHSPFCKAVAIGACGQRL